jgi:uncharacterized damage-inducible protein DinB
MKLPEPWLRGPIAGVHPLVAPVLYAFEQAREDVAHYTAGLSDEQLWERPHGFGSVGFHVRHIAGSVERLMTYLEGRGLSEGQLATLQMEHDPLLREELLAVLEQALRAAEMVVRGVDPTTLTDARTVGRLGLPTTVIGLLTHIAEHTQRHVGQAISAAKLAEAIKKSG